MIKAVIFDFFGVICHDEYWKELRRTNLLNDDVDLLDKKMNSGQVGWKEFLQEVQKKSGLTSKQIHWLYQTEQIDPRMIAFASELRKNLKTGILTNANHEYLDEIIARNFLYLVFDSFIISSRVGVTKPDPKIYTLALEELGINAEEAIFIDDIALNVDGAGEVGINAILYESFEQTQRDVVRLIANPNN